MKFISDTMGKKFFFGGILHDRTKPIIHRLMIALSVLIFGMIGSIGFVWYFHYQKNIERQSVEELHLMMREFQSLIAQQSSGLSVAIYPIVENDITKKGLREKDRQLLQKHWNGVYERMRGEKVSHFYFYDAQRVCLLRLHSPSKYGDKIERFTAKQSEILGKGTWGIELGTLGMFTLRVVEPVYDGNTLVGYVELGKEIEDVLNELYFHFSHEMLLSVDKQFITRSLWEEEMLRLGRKAKWDINPDFVISYATSEPISRFFGSRINEKHRHLDAGEIIKYQGKTYAVSYLPVYNASGKENAHLQVIRDTTKQSQDNVETLIWILGLGGIFGGVIMVIIKKVLVQIDEEREALFHLSSTQEQKRLNE